MKSQADVKHNSQDLNEIAFAWFKYYLRMAPRLLVIFLPFVLLGIACRPLWRRLLRVSITRKERAGTLKSLTSANGDRVILLYEQRGRWDEVVPHMDQLQRQNDRMKLACGFSLLYLHNGRLDEAIEAAAYWASTPANWALDNPQTAREVMSLMQKLPTWYLRPRPEKANEHVWGEEAMKVLQELMSLSNGMFVQYRDSRMALGILQWTKVRASIAPQSIKLQSSDREINPLLPFFGAMWFDYELARRLGMTDDEFDRVFEEAVKL